MRERTRTLAVPGRRPILGAALTLAAGTLVLLSSCGGDAKPPADGNTPPVDSSTGIAAPAPATGPKRAAGEYGANDVAFGGAGTALDSLASGWAGCPAPLTGALANGALDPSLGGFKPSLLSGEFTLSGFGFMATQPCPGSGQTGSPARAFESRWLHSSGVALQVNQRENATAVPNTLTPAMARFSANGFEYDLSVLYNPAFVDTTTVTPPDRPATGSGSGTTAGSIATSATTLDGGVEASSGGGSSGAVDEGTGASITTTDPGTSSATTTATTSASTTLTTTTATTDAAMCGDGVTEADEQCDGADLGGVSCESSGYAGGALACAADCSGFDFSGCLGCGGPDGSCMPFGQCGQAQPCTDGYTCIAIGNPVGTCMPPCDPGCADGTTCNESFNTCGIPCADDASCPRGMACQMLLNNEFACMW
jgi:hypothetical protein